jgi:hypothetical protein
MASHRLAWRNRRRLTSGGRHGPRSESQLCLGGSRCLFFSFDGSEPHKLTRQCTYRIESSLTRPTLDAGLAKFDNAREMFVVSEPAGKQVVSLIR